ncbi:MAG: class I SAM-dependent methyltransferase [Gammaproteobacteria bacterium]|nr:class I SAM-dependent methyltransferase [Gammaproteobacteria bacterium]
MSRYLKKSYLSLPRLCAYLEQYKYVNEGDRILEVGKGSGVFGDIAKKIADYTSIDIDKATFPDIVASILDWKSLKEHAKNFDVIFCCQVLEHMPLEESKVALNNLMKLEAKRIVISLPDNRTGIKLRIKLSKLDLRTVITLPWSGANVNITNNAEHHWEIGGDITRKLISVFSRPCNGYRIVERYRLFERPKQHFFVYEQQDQRRQEIVDT